MGRLASAPLSPAESPEREAIRLIESGNALEDQGRLAEALAAYDAAIAASPALARAHLNRGNALSAQRDYKGALESFARASSLDPASAGIHYNTGNAYAQSGRHAEALEAYARALTLQPEFVDAEFMRGCMLEELARYEEAEASYRRALALRPGYEQVHLNLLGLLARMGDAQKQAGRADDAARSYERALQIEVAPPAVHYRIAKELHALGRLDAAVAVYRRVLHAEPAFEEAHINLGNALRSLGQLPDAAASFRKAIEIQPASVVAQVNLGAALREMGQLHEAAACYARAIEIEPQRAEAHVNLGNVYQAMGRLQDAIESFRAATQARPDFAEAHYNLGNALRDAGRSAESLACFERAIALKPGYADACLNLGIALAALGRTHEAIASYRRAIELNPRFPNSHSSLGNALGAVGRLEEAVASHRRAIELDPTLAEAHNNLGNALKDMGLLADAIGSYERAVELKPDYFAARSNILFATNYLARLDPEAALEQARAFGRIATASRKAEFTSWSCTPAPRRLRVGFVSGDLRSHPVGYFLHGLLANLDPARVEVHLYSTFDRSDELTEVLRRHSARWHSIANADDASAAAQIHRDAPHVLVDLSGHTAHNRLPMFAYRPAPVQASWLGYFATTGVAEIDWLLGDPRVTPPSERSHFSERTWLLPDSYLCFSPPPFDLQPSPLPALVSGRVTFGCFNNLAKVNDEVVALWARVLRAVPHSRLILKTIQLNDANVCATTARRFAAHDIAPDRLVLEGSAPRAELMASYRRVDIALDPFPYPGGTTSVEALWMGVPVVTRRGDRFLSHVGESVAHAAGLADWIAGDDADYVAKASAWAADLPRLASLRAGLRAQAVASPVFDAPRYARSFEDALWGMWRDANPAEATT